LVCSQLDEDKLIFVVLEMSLATEPGCWCDD